MRRFVLFLEVWAVVAITLALPTPALAQTAPAETPTPTAYTDAVQGTRSRRARSSTILASAPPLRGRLPVTCRGIWSSRLTIHRLHPVPM